MSSREGVKGRTRRHKLRSAETKATTHVGGANEPAVELKKDLDARTRELAGAVARFTAARVLGRARQRA